jgi:hypothetical protein
MKTVNSSPQTNKKEKKKREIRHTHMCTDVHALYKKMTDACDYHII